MKEDNAIENMFEVMLKSFTEDLNKGESDKEKLLSLRSKLKRQKNFTENLTLSLKQAEEAIKELKNERKRIKLDLIRTINNMGVLND